MGKKVSILIRTKNEGRWIKQCLSSIRGQSYRNFEVILIDNMSTDATVKKASSYDVKHVNIENYRPGYAINQGIKNSTGDIFVILSGHCVPTNEFWLENLISNLADENVAGVYGRQEPLSFSADADKRDLAIVFGLDKKVQEKDSFFHNANSALTRAVWEEFPFDNEVNHIEDRLWGKDVIRAGYRIIYEPEASVYHYHGIHQNNHPERLKNVVSILEEHDVVQKHDLENGCDFATIVPINEPLDEINGCSSLHYIVDTIQSSQYLSMAKAVIATNIPTVIQEAEKLGFNHIYHRPDHLSGPFVTLNAVIKHTLMEHDFHDAFPDAVVYLSPKFPYRPHKVIDGMILDFIEGGYDVLFPTYNERRTVWFKDDQGIVQYETTMPTKLKKGIEVALTSLCTIARSEYYLDKKDKTQIGLYEINDPIYLYATALDLKSDTGKHIMQYLLK